MSARELDVFSVLRLRLRLDEVTRHRLDVTLPAVGQLERALTRWGLGNLDAMRRTRRWRAACNLPTGLSSSGEVADREVRRARSAALNALRKEFHVTAYDFVGHALKLRKQSSWLCHHVPSSSAIVHAAEVYEAFAAHLFRGAGRPRVPRPWDNCVLQGYVRDVGRGGPTDEEVERATTNGRKPPRARNTRWTGLSLRGSYFEDDLAVHLNLSRDRARNLVIPVRTLGGAEAEREAWYLSDPDSWHQLKIVKREVRGHHDYEVHLLCTKAPYRDPARYAAVPDAVVGVDLGVSTLAAVGVDGDGAVTAALLIRPTAEELELRREVARKRVRALRALERSRRATNPDAYGLDRHGRPGRGSRRPGVRLTTSKAYRRQRRVLRDKRRREHEARAITTNCAAICVVQRCGTRIVTEDVSVKAWQRTWGRSIGHFAPSELIGALEREARLAGGSLTKVPCRLGLTQTCHCGVVAKKSLSERWHRCDACGSGCLTSPIDRDLHSAFLAAFVTSTDPHGSTIAVTLDTDRALAAWSGAEAPLVAVSGDPRQGRTSPPRSRVASSWSRRNVSNRAGRETASDVDPDNLGRAGDSLTGDAGVGKAHASRLRYEASISEFGGRPARQLRLDG